MGYLQRKFALLFCLSLFIMVGCTAQPVAPNDTGSAETPLTTPVLANTPTSSAPPGGADGVAVSFLQAWEREDYSGMYSLLADRTQGFIDEGTFTQRYRGVLDEARVSSIAAQPLAFQGEGTQSELTFRVTLHSTVVGDIVRENQIPMIYEAGRWGVLWDEDLILPELIGGNRIDLIITAPSRAAIYDRGDTLLAYQGEARVLHVIPVDLEDEAGFLAAVAPLFGRTAAEIQSIYADLPPEWRIPLGAVSAETIEINYSQLSPFLDKGLAMQAATGRLYNNENIAPHLLGFTGAIPENAHDQYLQDGYELDDRVGISGLEAWGEPYLSGRRSGILRLLDPAGNEIKIVQETEAHQARDIHASFDAAFQTAVQQALAEAIESHPLGHAGAIVALDVNSGAVLAMASYPTYSPDIFDEIRPDAQSGLQAALNNPGRVLLNRASQGEYPPGSVFKIVTASAGLLSGFYGAESRYTCTGTWDGLGPELIKHDWTPAGHGNITLVQGLERSCNPYMYEIGFVLDGNNPFTLPDTARAFGLGAPTGIQGVPEQAGTIPDPDWKWEVLGEGWSPGDSVNMAIGQGFVEVTPLQMANLTAAVANGGTLYRPLVANRISAGGGAPEELVQPEVMGLLPISAEQLFAVQSGMDAVTSGYAGTAANRFLNFPVPTAGKTGTAETGTDADPFSWFTGYAPVGNYTTQDGRTLIGPEIAVTVMIENAGEGSSVAAPIFRRVLELFYGIPVTPFPWQ